MIRVAVLCHYPPSWFARHGVQFDAWRVQGELDNEAFSSVEGLLTRGLAESDELDLHVISFSKAIRRKQSVSIGKSTKLELLPAPPLSGMPIAWLPRLLMVRRLLSRIRPQVVHGIRNLEGYGFFAAFSQYPSVITPHEFLSGVPRPWHMEFAFSVARAVEAATLRKAREIITITDHVRRHVQQRSSARITPIPNIVHPLFYEVNKAPQPAGILFVGRISPEKGLLDLLRAARLLRARGHVIPVAVVGGPSGAEGITYLTRCQAFVQRELEPGQVKFLGWRTTAEIAEMHRQTALFVMPSQAPYETMGLVIAEALAAGTPSIVYDFGPLPMLIRPGSNGYVIPTGDIEKLADRIDQVLSNRCLLAEMSRDARQGVHQFRLEVIVEAHLSLYRKIAAETRAFTPER